MAISPRDCVPKDWTKLLKGGPLGLGLDLATTEKKTSNPSSVCVTERVGALYVERLVLNFKTAREEVTRAIMQVIFEDLNRAKMRPLRLCVDASNERFFAQRVQGQFTKYCPVALVVMGENLEWKGEELSYKDVLTNLYLNTYDDALMRTPNARWLEEDRRLLKKRKGTFDADETADGKHADSFTSGMLARWALEGRGRAELTAVAVGQGIGATKGVPAGLRNPLLKMAQQLKRRMTNA